MNLLFTKNLFAHYSELFNLLVNSFKNGEIDYLEIEKKGKINDLKYFFENDYKLFNDEIILKEIKNSLLKQSKINILLFTEFLGIVSIKVKFESKISEIEKAFYIFEKIRDSDNIIKKILIRNGNTL